MLNEERAERTAEETERRIIGTPLHLQMIQVQQPAAGLQVDTISYYYTLNAIAAFVGCSGDGHQNE